MVSHYDCPYCYEGRKGRRAHRGHFGYHKCSITRSSREMGIVRRGRPDVGGVHGRAHFDDPAFAREFPNLAEFLTLEVWPDGIPRVPGTALAFAEAGRVKVCLSDKDAQMVCFCTAPDWAGAWAAAEAALAPGGGDWRPMRKAPQRKP
jgi:hypothetical protein